MKRVIISILLSALLVSSEQYYQDNLDYTYLIGVWRQTTLIKNRRRDDSYDEKHKTFYISEKDKNVCDCYLSKQGEFLYITINYGKENDTIRIENAGGIYVFNDFDYDYDRQHQVIEAEIEYCIPENKKSIVLFEVVNKDSMYVTIDNISGYGLKRISRR